MVGESRMRLQFSTNMERSMPLTLSYDLSPIDPAEGVIYAALILIGLYILIIFEVSYYCFSLYF